MEGRDENGKFTEKNLWAYVKKNSGRPMNFDTPQALLSKALEYFEWSSEVDKGKFTLAGLRVYIGFNRSTWHDYKVRPEFSYTMNLIEEMLEDFYEKKLGWAGSTQGAIFWLKNKAGWKDEITNNNNDVVRHVTIEEKTRDAK
jgi:hypothetical protein